MDNGAAFRGFTDRVRMVGRLIRWLCSLGIIPLYNAPNSPWNNGSVEGGNSVFDKKFWQRFRFKNLEVVDDKLKNFNQDYKSYLVPDYKKFLKLDLPQLIDPRKLKAKETKSFIQSS